MQLPRARVVLAVLAAFFLVISFQAALASDPQASKQAASPQTDSGAGYADNSICQTCHQEIWEKHFAGTPHSALLKRDQHGCQACHGPAQAHVEGGGDVTKIIRFEELRQLRPFAMCSDLEKFCVSRLD